MAEVYEYATSVVSNGVTVQQWDDVTRTYSDFRTSPTTTRAYTAPENVAADRRATAATAAANNTALRNKARQAIAANDTFLALTGPTNSQVVAQVQRLTREATALIRLTIGALDSMDGT